MLAPWNANVEQYFWRASTTFTPFFSGGQHRRRNCCSGRTKSNCWPRVRRTICDRLLKWIAATESVCPARHRNQVISNTGSQGATAMISVLDIYTIYDEIMIRQKRRTCDRRPSAANWWRYVGSAQMTQNELSVQRRRTACDITWQRNQFSRVVTFLYAVGFAALSFSLFVVMTSITSASTSTPSLLLLLCDLAANTCDGDERKEQAPEVAVADFVQFSATNPFSKFCIW